MQAQTVKPEPKNHIGQMFSVSYVYKLALFYVIFEIIL